MRKPQLAERVTRAQRGNADVPVVISADKGVKYEQVVNVMRLLQTGRRAARRPVGEAGAMTRMTQPIRLLRRRSPAAWAAGRCRDRSCTGC